MTPVPPPPAEIMQQLLDKSSNFITQLADQLGVSAKYAFEVLVKYQQATGIAMLSSVLFWFLFQLGFHYLVVRPIFRSKALEKTDYEDKTFGCGMFSFAVAVFSVLLAKFFFEAFLLILSPEGAAIKFIFESISS